MVCGEPCDEGRIGVGARAGGEEGVEVRGGGALKAAVGLVVDGAGEGGEHARGLGAEGVELLAGARGLRGLASWNEELAEQPSADDLAAVRACCGFAHGVEGVDGRGGRGAAAGEDGEEERGERGEAGEAGEAPLG